MTVGISTSNQCLDHSVDRKLGSQWERNFCTLAVTNGIPYTDVQRSLNSSNLLTRPVGNQIVNLPSPDVILWTKPTHHHEVKHKNPDRRNRYGLEVHRLEALQKFSEVTGDDVYYTIHNHDLSGGKFGKNNNLDHWVTINITELEETWIAQGYTKGYHVGETRDRIPIYYWPAGIWEPLKEYLLIEASMRIKE